MTASTHPLAAAILAADDRPLSEPHTFPEWGGAVLRFRSMNGADGATFSQLAYRAQKAPPDDPIHRELAARAVVYTACDADGVQVFGLEHVGMLAQRAHGALQRAAGFALDVSGLSDKGAADASGNSATPGESSGSE